MKSDIRSLYDKYKDYILYVVFGILTTITNIVTYWIMAHIFNVGTVPSSIVAWVVCISVAYITNRRLVFHSEAKNLAEILKEVVNFYFCRLATGVLDWGFMYLTVDIWKLNDMIMKCLITFLVIVLNFVASKHLIFKREN